MRGHPNRLLLPPFLQGLLETLYYKLELRAIVRAGENLKNLKNKGNLHLIFGGFGLEITVRVAIRQVNNIPVIQIHYPK